MAFLKENVSLLFLPNSGRGGGYCPLTPPPVLVIRQSRQIGLHVKESHLPDVSSVVTHTTSSEIVGFYDSSTFSLFKNFVIYLMSVKLFLDRNKELLEKQTNNSALYIYQENLISSF